MLTNENKWQKVIKAEIYQNAYRIRVSGGDDDLPHGEDLLPYGGNDLPYGEDHLPYNE